MSEAEDAAAREAILAWRNDHHELERRIALFQTALKAGSQPAAQSCLEAFSNSVLAHLRVEEEIAFPLAERVLEDGEEPVRSPWPETAPDIFSSRCEPSSSYEPNTKTVRSL